MTGRHVILTLGRSGSNTLVNLINQNPHILNVGEVLGDWNRIKQIRDRLGLYRNDDAGYLDAVTRPSAFLRALNFGRSVGRLIQAKPSEIKSLSVVDTIGIKEFSLLLEKHDQLAWLSDRADVKVIGLQRDDVLDRFVSSKALSATGVVSASTNQDTKSAKINIDPEEIFDQLLAVSRENLLLERVLGSLPEERVFRITYDDFYKNEERRREITSNIFRFLDVPPWNTEIRMKKIISRPPQEVIENRQDCAAALVGTEFEGLLD